MHILCTYQDPPSTMEKMVFYPLFFSMFTIRLGWSLKQYIYIHIENPRYVQHYLCIYIYICILCNYIYIHALIALKPSPIIPSSHPTPTSEAQQTAEVHISQGRGNAHLVPMQLDLQSAKVKSWEFRRDFDG